MRLVGQGRLIWGGDIWGEIWIQGANYATVLGESIPRKKRK